MSLFRHHQGGKVEPAAHPLPDWRTRSYSCWHVDGGLPHGHTTHPATKVRCHSFPDKSGSKFIDSTSRETVCVAFQSDKVKQQLRGCMFVFYGHSTAFKPYTVCGCTESDTWSAGWLMSLQLIAAQEFTISIKFESSNIETLKTTRWGFIYYLSPSGRVRVPGTPSSLEKVKQDLDGQIKTDKLQMRGLLLLLSWHIPARFVYVFVCVSMAMAELWRTALGVEKIYLRLQ